MKFSAIKYLLLVTLVYSFAQTGAKYLIISHNSFVQSLKPLIDWKIKKGMPTKCVPLSITGYSSQEIKSYIQNAYNTWNPKPEYILLVGSPDLLPTYNYYYDDYYADMTGDYKIELSIGRFHCQTTGQCSVMVFKSIGYEKSLTMHDSTWFAKGTTIVREDIPPDEFYQFDCRYIRNLWHDAGFVQIDSFHSNQGHNQNDVIDAINNGRSYVIFRGQSVTYWWPPFDVDPESTNNGYKLPVIISGTCATVTLSTWEHMLADDCLRAGTVQNPKGAVGFFGTTLVDGGVSLYRGTVTRGFFTALYLNVIFKLGDATKRAKFILDSLYHNQPRYMEWNLLGDPELNLWTAMPNELTVTHDTVIFLQPTNFQVLVKSNGLPVPQALVCAMMDSTVYSYGYTNYSGLATFTITPQHVGTLQVTVTGHNYFPFEGGVPVRVADGLFISGNVRYYSNQNSVESTKVILSGAIVDTTLTNSSGFYAFTNLPTPQNYSVNSFKINSSHSTAISSYDGALVLRHVVGLDTLDSLQFIAGEVSGNSLISAYDAALVLQYAIALRHHFPVGAGIGADTVDWAFRPASRSYSPLQANQSNQNYNAILYGDVSGNWTSTEDNAAIPSLKVLETGLKGTDIITENELLVLPIKITDVKDVISAEILFTYDPNQIEIKQVTTGNSTKDYLIAWSDEKGLMKIALAGTSCLNGEVELARVYHRQKQVGKMNQPVNIKMQSIVFNEGQNQNNVKPLNQGEQNIATIPPKFTLISNQPNPFKLNTVFCYSLSAACKVSFFIYNSSGRLIKTTVNGNSTPGLHQLIWNGLDDKDMKVAPGVYFLDVKIGDKKYITNKKIILLK